MRREFDIGSELEGWLNNLESEINKSWGTFHDEPPEHIDPKTWSHANLLLELSEVMIRSAQKLQQDSRVQLDEILEFFEERGRDLTEDEFIRQSVEINLAYDFCGRLSQMSRRTLELVRFLVVVESAVTRDYLLRVADCYIRGLRAETVIMCGAALEAALDEFLPTDDRRLTLGMKISELAEEGTLPERAESLARTISTSRNDAVHLRLEAIPENPIETIEALHETLALLEGKRER